VRRRLTALLVVWVALLGVGSPALACAFRDCCATTGSHLPCETGGRSASLAAEAARCCVTAPAPSSSVCIVAARINPDGHHGAGFSGPAVLVNGAIAPAIRPLTPNPVDHSYRVNASQTYLHTARLRL
jgi:hypothetical protein